MTWREQLRRVTLPDGRKLIGASFRGVPFFVESSDRSGGRRLVVHEYPLRDRPVVEDLGRRARVYPLTGYVVGDDYLEQRDKLIAALEEFGPGQLVHPYYRDTIRASCESFTTSESRDQGGQATFAIEFREVPEAKAPVVVNDLDSLTKDAATAALLTVVADLGTTYDVSGQSSTATASLAADVRIIASGLRDQLGPVVSAASELHDDAQVAIQELAALDVRTQLLIDAADQLILSPVDLFDQTGAVLAAILRTAEVAPRSVMLALFAVVDIAAPLLALGDTPTRERERQNQVALGGALRTRLVLAGAELIVDVEYASLEDAEADRGQLLDRLDDQIAVATDAVYTELLDVRAAVVQAVPGNEELARVQTSHERQSIPSLVLSHRLYGTVDGESDILGRNPTTAHPGFMNGDIEVLSAI